MISFPGGLAELPRALAARLADRLRPGSRVAQIAATPGGGFTLHHHDADGAPCTLTADHLVLTTPARATAALLDSLSSSSSPALSSAAQHLRAIPHASLAIASLGIDSAQARLPRGFGFLVARGSAASSPHATPRILGAIAASNVFPGRAPAGCAALAVFLGGMLDPTVLDLPDSDLAALVQRDLAQTIGLSGAPRVLRIQRWPAALPQYDLAHGARLAAYAAAEQALPGLHLAGNWRGGPALGDRIEQTRLLAQQHLIPACRSAAHASF